MANAIKTIVGVLLFIVASEFSSRLIQSNAARDWVDVALYIGFTGFMLSQIVLSIQQSQHNSTWACE